MQSGLFGRNCVQFEKKQQLRNNRREMYSYNKDDLEAITLLIEAKVKKEGWGEGGRRKVFARRKV